MSILARFHSPQSGAGRRCAAVAGGVLASLLVCAGAAAQFGPSIELPPGLPTLMPATLGGYPPSVAPTAVGTYFTPPTWSSALAPNVRFVILSNFNNDAVLDRETGLVWARQSVARMVGPTFFAEPDQNVTRAPNYCRRLTIGTRMGWRLPTLAELQSLLDSSLPVTAGPKIPAGHPFLLSPSGTNPNSYYFAAEAFFDDLANLLDFKRRFEDLRNGQAAAATADELIFSQVDVLCVRGGRAPGLPL